MTIRRRLYAGAWAALVVLGTACAATGPAASPNSGATPRPRESTAAERDTLRDATLKIDELIRRRVPGVDVVTSASGLDIRARGTAGATGSGQVLVIVDGVELPSPSALLSINPADVMKIELVKDAAASFYGLRGHNGVLLITTRRR